MIRSALIRIVGTDYGDTNIYLTPDEYERRLVEYTDAIIREHHPHLLNTPAEPPTPAMAYTEGKLHVSGDGTHNKGGRHHAGETSYGARGDRATTRTNLAPALDGIAVLASVKGVTKTPEMCEGRARIAGTNVPVWMIVDASTRGATNEDMELHWHVTHDQIEDALAYYDAHPDEIEEDLRQETK